VSDNALASQCTPLSVGIMEAGQDDLYDARFEFDAPRYYDFETMSGGTPADKWFDTAPDGPGCKPESEQLQCLLLQGAVSNPYSLFVERSHPAVVRAEPGTSREPFKQLQDNASNQQQVGIT